MSDKTWYVGDVVWGTSTMVYEGNDDPHKGLFVCDCDGFMFDDEIRLAGDNNPQHTAQQIANEHNTMLSLTALFARWDADDAGHSSYDWSGYSQEDFLDKANGRLAQIRELVNGGSSNGQ